MQWKWTALFESVMARRSLNEGRERITQAFAVPFNVFGWRKYYSLYNQCHQEMDDEHQMVVAAYMDTWPPCDFSDRPHLHFFDFPSPFWGMWLVGLRKYCGSFSDLGTCIKYQSATDNNIWFVTQRLNVHAPALQSASDAFDCAWLMSQLETE